MVYFDWLLKTKINGAVVNTFHLPRGVCGAWSTVYRLSRAKKRGYTRSRPNHGFGMVFRYFRHFTTYAFVSIYQYIYYVHITHNSMYIEAIYMFCFS